MERTLLRARLEMSYSSLRLAFILSLAACAVDEPASSDDPSPAGGKADDGTARLARSHVGDAVLAALEATAPGERGRSWSVSTDNRLDTGWLVQSPPAAHWHQPAAALQVPALCTSGASCDLDFGLLTCTTDAQCGTRGRCVALAATRRSPSQMPRRVCAGHSDVTLLDELHGLVVSALTCWINCRSMSVGSRRSTPVFLGACPDCISSILSSCWISPLIPRTATLTSSLASSLNSP
jgi:hypothetical protein